MMEDGKARILVAGGGADNGVKHQYLLGILRGGVGCPLALSAGITSKNGGPTQIRS